MVRFVFFSISRLVVMLEAAKGIRTVLMQVIIRCMILMTVRKCGKYVKSGSFWQALQQPPGR